MILKDLTLNKMLIWQSLRSPWGGIPHDSQIVSQQEWAPPPAAITGPSTQPGLPSFLSVSTLYCAQDHLSNELSFIVCFEGNPNQTEENGSLTAAILTGSSITNSGNVNLSKLPEMVEARGAGVLLSMGSQRVVIWPRDWAATTAITDSFRSSHPNLSSHRKVIVFLGKPFGMR